MRIPTVGRIVDPEIMVVVDVIDVEGAGRSGRRGDPTGLHVERRTVAPGRSAGDPATIRSGKRGLRRATVAIHARAACTGGNQWKRSSGSISERRTARSPSSRRGGRSCWPRDGDPILPSVVGLDLQGKLLVGRAARNQYALSPRTHDPVDQAQNGTGHYRRAREPELPPAGGLGHDPPRAQAARGTSARTSREKGRHHGASRSSRKGSARRRARPASWPGWRWCGSSTSQPPPS